VLLVLAESLKVPPPLLHLAGLLLLAGRSVHAYGLSQNPHNLRLRTWGMILTFAAIAVAALFCFGFGVFNLIV
jgi:uncharacterized membrane protein YecN with MAPEG domain